MDAQSQLRSEIMLVVSYTIILFFSLFIPAFFPFAIILLPIPIIVYATNSKADRLYMIIGILAVFTFVLTVILQILWFIPLFVTSVISGLAIGLAIQKEKSPYETWIQGTIGFVISLLFIFVFTQYVLEINWVEEIRIASDQSITNIMNMLKEIDPSIESQIEGQMEILREQLFYMPNLIPAVIAILSIVFAFIAQWISYKVLNRRKEHTYRFPAVRRLSFPMAIFWLYIGASLLMLFETNPTSGLFIVLQNINSLMSFLLIIQGFTFVFFFAHHKKQSNALPFIVLTLSLIITPLVYIIRLVGLIDMALSLRKRLRGSQTG